MKGGGKCQVQHFKPRQVKMGLSRGNLELLAMPDACSKRKTLDQQGHWLKLKSTVTTMRTSTGAAALRPGVQVGMACTMRFASLSKCT